MEIRMFLCLFLFALPIIDNVIAGRSGSSRGSSRSFSSGRTSSRAFGSSAGSYRHGSTSSAFGRGTSSSSHTSSSSQSGGSPPGWRTTGSSPSQGSSSGWHAVGSKPSGHENPSSGQTVGSNPAGHRSLSSQTSHQQNKDLSSSFLNAEGGGATRPSQTNAAQFPVGRSSTAYSNTGTNSNDQMGKPGIITESKSNSAPYKPSAPPSEHLSKSTSGTLQNQGPTSFGQPNAPFNQPHGNIPYNNPSWGNPHFNPNQPYPPSPTSTNIGFRNDLRPSSMPYPQSSYPTSNLNQHPPPYPVHSFNNPSQPHHVYNPSSSFPGQPFGHPYPSHVAPNAFGNPYSTHPVGSPYAFNGQNYRPQQHVLAQPAAQPYIPGQTVIMMPNQQDSGRGFGQMVKEALVFSTINAGVNRLINPHHHYIPDSRPSTGSATSETHITYNNQYFNSAPSSNPSIPISPNAPQGNTPITNPMNYPSSINDPSITPGVLIPIIIGNKNNTSSAVNGYPVSVTDTINNTETSPAIIFDKSTSNTVNSNQQARSSNETAVNQPQYKISDDELMILTEELFAKQEIDVSKYFTLSLQDMATSSNITDKAKGPLIYTQREIYDYPTIFVIRALYDTYEHNSTVKENRTLAIRKKEDLLLDIFLHTNIMARTMQWLSNRGFIDPDDFEKKDTLRHIWFSQFDGATSGFERVFTSERYGSDLLGVQDWLYFDYQESKKRIDYMGYVDTLKLGDKATLVKVNFQMDGIIRPNATIFVGTLPELEMSLYTICFYARPNNLCPVSLGGSKFNIFTHSFRYYGKDLIDLALPIF